ncbi:uncharacterized protein LOC111615858 isoform X2 [Centruroides sculpturatus]|uniref:uncharacterized protein LOC111615858 isoform X2 n=1 Tax=Centruroides sculpturatus TaxID=218467 RepID=UPI000C6EB0F0|nr:uncharacterized protein LOC111615858 isoform X2 [Centruroides sculpturatus]
MYDGEDVFCSVWMGIWSNYLLGGIACGLSAAGLFVFAAKKEYQQLSDELSQTQRSDLNLQNKLKEFLMRHEEIWNFVSQLNNKQNFAFVGVYVGMIFEASFCYYMHLFIEMAESIRFVVLGAAVILTYLDAE